MSSTNEPDFVGVAAKFSGKSRRTLAEEVAEVVLRRTEAIAVVPAATGEEAERAAVVEGWWLADGIDQVQQDSIGNVWGQLRAGSGPSTVVSAHLDTVFGRDTEHRAEFHGSRLVGPGVGDNAVAIAALSALDMLLPRPTHRPVWILATVAEEGLGNLAGIIHALRHAPTPFGELIVLEGNYLRRVCISGVGSLRWRILLRGPGGHAWEHADAPSAIQAAAALTIALDELNHAAPPRRMINVGRIGGGEGINVRASTAWLEVDFRAETESSLAELARKAEALISTCGSQTIRTEITEIGRRPAGGIASDHLLVRSAVEALRLLGHEPQLTAASTDANAAHAKGVPAITLGITTGGGEHTATEWIDTLPIADGLAALANTILRLHDTDGNIPAHADIRVPKGGGL